MKIIRDVHEMQRTALALREKAIPVGVAPTMGYFHDGHLSLMRRAKQENDICVVTLFVNPTQFGKNEDLSKYPRNEARDSAMAESVGADILFMPPPEAMYPDGFQTYVDVEEVSRPMCGESRPGHFRGVATVVTKLFMLTQPRRAYFGLKDYQQCQVIRRMTGDLNIPVDLVFCPIVREPDGLAMSSRNVYLTKEERRAATVLSRALENARRFVEQGQRHAEKIRDFVKMQILAEPLAAIDYVEAVDAQSLQPIGQIAHPMLVAVAVRFGKTRLIDNIVIGI
jgi:pantoate--beta-alanine ligase